LTRWLVPILLFLVATLLAVGLGWGANYGLGSAIALGEGETLERVRVGAGAADPAADGDAGDAPVAASDTVQAPRGLTRRQYVDAILARNIFDSSNIGNPGDDSDDPCEGDDCEYANSDLPVRLIATAVATQAMLSAALIEEENSKDYAGYGVGDKLLDSTILAIEWDRVIVKRADGAEEVILASEEAGSAKSSTPVSSGDATEDGICLLYTSDAADDLTRVGVGGRRGAETKKDEPSHSELRHT